MFTGLIEEVGECLWLRPAANSIQFAVMAPGMLRQIHTGESVAVNGACLTVSSQSEERLDFDLLQETVLRTNFGDLRPGSKVNLERALQADGRLGGHFVQGHVDCAALVLACEEHRGDLKLAFQLPLEFSQYVATKGSICVNGVSLTVAELTEKSFSVWIIPHTRRVTNLGDLAKGSRVNLEFDILAKYAERILASGLKPQTPLS
jgi:riboflavin synthase